jgi:uncharacterized protein YaiI (UPF0178 family)
MSGKGEAESGKALRIWVDDDGCPRATLDLLLRAAERRRIPVVRVANRSIRPYDSGLISAVRVGSDFDAADRYIAEHVAAGDLVVTADVALAAEIVARGAFGLSPRGDEFNPDNAGAKLAMRDLMHDLRAAGAVQGGPPSPGPADRRRFSDALDRLLTRLTARP